MEATPSILMAVYVAPSCEGSDERKAGAYVIGTGNRYKTSNLYSIIGAPELPPETRGYLVKFTGGGPLRIKSGMARGGGRQFCMLENGEYTRTVVSTW